MTDQDIMTFAGLALTLITVALGSHRYIGATADKLRAEWKVDVTEVRTRVEALDVSVDTLRDRLATKDDLGRVESQLRDMNAAVNHQGAIEERIIGIQRQLDIIIAGFRPSAAQFQGKTHAGD